MQLGPSYWNETVRDYQLRRTSEILRGPLEWSLDLTNQCVGKCLHCFNRSGRLPRDEMDDHTVLQVVRQIAEIRPLGLCLCGGEPLLRSGLAYRVVELLSDAKVLVNMVTSGALVTPEVACNLKNSGIKMVQVSLDGASAESHDRLRQKPGAFKLAVQALMYLKEAGITTSVAFSPTRFNTEEFAEVIALSERLSVTDLRIQPLMPIGEALFHWEEIVPSPVQYQRLVDLLRERACETRSRLKIVWGDPVDHLIRFGQ
ncbi:MAG: radical SAM protein, partial [Deltaproteobacteria bacterium]